MKRKRLVLVDGHAMIHRAFHAVPELSTSTGEPVNATFGFTSMLMKAILEEMPDYIAMTFDLPSPTFRHLEYSQYKAHRPPLPDTMRPQFGRIRELVQSFDIPIYEKDGFEADDVLGTLSVQATQQGVDTIIYTGDMDTLQLVDEHVTVKVAKRGISEITEYHVAEVEARYGFLPKILPDFKGLVGDKSDNIPGVPGIGEKTASKLLAEYSDLEGVLAHIDVLKQKEQKLLRDATEQARQSKYLATIVLDVPVQLDLEACRITISSDKVLALFRELGFRSLVEKVLALFSLLQVTVHDTLLPIIPDSVAENKDLLLAPPMGVVPILEPPLPPDVDAKSTPPVEAALIPPPPDVDAESTPPVETALIPPAGAIQSQAGAHEPTQLNLFEVPTLRTESVRRLRLPHVTDTTNRASMLPDESTQTMIIDSEEALDVLIKSLYNAGCFAFDTETTSEDPRLAQLVGISCSTTAGEAYYIPVGHTLSIDGQEPDTQLLLEDVLEQLKPVLEDQTVQKYLHNAKYDMSVLARYGIVMRGLVFDTMLGAYLAEPGRRGLGLKDQVFQRLGSVMTPITDLIGSGSKTISMAQVPVRQAAEYAGADADMTLRLVEPIRTELRQHGLMNMYTHVELPLVEVLMQMERYGVALNAAFLREFGYTLKEQLDSREQEIYASVGRKFNINSTKQLSEILFTELKLPSGKKTKTGYSVSVDVIEGLQGKHPMIDALLEYRQLTKLKSTYVDGLLALIDPVTGRVYTSFNQTIASSGRLSSSNPNLQNIPVRTELGRQIRRAFIPNPTYLLLTADYSQFELRILAHITHEPRLVEAFTNNEDIHTITAASLFAVPVEQVTKDQRRLAKTVVYAILYGQSAFGLSQITGMNNAEAATFIRRYHETFPNIKGYVDGTLNQARTQGYVNTLFGRKRFFPDMHALSHVERQALEREAINMPIQGTNADWIKIAMIRLHHALREKHLSTRMILQVHDELVFEVPQEELERAKRLIKRIMEGVYDLSVPIKVDMKVGTNWYEAEPL